jgi:hypothetical protein
MFTKGEMEILMRLLDQEWEMVDEEDTPAVEALIEKVKGMAKQPFADHKDKEPVGRPMADYAREGLGPSRSAMILPCHGDKPR